MRVETVLFRRFGHAVENSGGAGAGDSVRKQEVLAIYYKRFYAPFRTIITAFYAPVKQVAFQIFPLVQRIVDGFPDLAFCGDKRLNRQQPRMELVQDWRRFLVTHGMAHFERLVLDVALYIKNPAAELLANLGPH